MPTLVMSLVEPDLQNVSVTFQQDNDITADDLIDWFIRAANAFGFDQENIETAVMEKAFEINQYFTKKEKK